MCRVTNIMGTLKAFFEKMLEEFVVFCWANNIQIQKRSEKESRYQIYCPCAFIIGWDVTCLLQQKMISVRLERSF